MSIRRALFAISLTAAVSLALFVLASRSPFDPLAGYLGDRYLTMSTADKQRVATELGLDAPWWQQWASWIGHAATGELGSSRSYTQPVTTVLAERGPWTLLLSGTALAAAIVLALAAGMWAGLHPRGRLDRVIAATTTVVQAVPPFGLSLGAVTISLCRVRPLFIAQGSEFQRGRATCGMRDYLANPQRSGRWVLVSIGADGVLAYVSGHGLEGQRSRLVYSHIG